MHFELHFNTSDHRMLNSNGEWVDSNRPLLEELHECKVHKNPKLFQYINVSLSPDIKIVQVGGHREIYAKVSDVINLRDGAE